MQTDLMSVRLESALRWAALCHDGQKRRGSAAPYFEHLAAVAIILGRAGFDEDVVIAGVLHDMIEDTAATLDDIASHFGPLVAEIVRGCSEVKTDATGQKRPWIDRKHDHLAAMRDAPLGAKGVMLADKLHNLLSIEFDLLEGHPIWSRFNADRAHVLGYYQAAIDACGHGDHKLEQLALACRDALARLTALA
jgi:(p)ppGpp synthase/HD superfamily hydrolase